MIINLHKSITINGNVTLRKYLKRYAPPLENDTAKYIQVVFQKTGVGPNEKIQFDFEKLGLF